MHSDIEPMEVSLQPRGNPMLTGKGLAFLIVVSLCSSLLCALQLAFTGIEKGNGVLAIVAIMSLSGNSEFIRPSMNTRRAYLLRGVIAIIGSSVALWIYVGCSKLLQGIEPEFLRLTIAFIPVAAIGLLAMPVVSTRWVDGSAYTNPFRGRRPIGLAAAVVFLAALWAGILIGMSVLFAA